MPTGQTTTTLWRLDELASQCRRLLDFLDLDEGESRRVRWEPNARLLRYYTTLGLLDRAEQMVGRTAFYGRKHLLQLLSIKKLQKEGRSLQEIQALLLGLACPDLENFLKLPNGWGDQLEPSPEPAPPPEPPRRNFWEALPAPAPTPPEVMETRQLLELQVAPGLTVQIDSHQFDIHRLAELQQALQAFTPNAKSSGGRT